MRDVILWIAVVGLPAIAIIGTIISVCRELRQMDAEEQRHLAYVDTDLTLWRAYNTRHGKTLSCTTGEVWERPRLLRPSATSDQSGDSRRRGDC
jgi:hypothetical protein